MYIEINGEKYPCKCSTFHTQTGKNAVRIISEAPIAEGFRLVGEDDSVVADYSDYVYLYRTEGETIKEYTKESEDIIPAIGYTTGIPENPIQAQISALNRRITEITPYTESQEVGIQAKECVFNGMYRDGVLTARVVTSRGEQIPCTYEKEGDNVTVRFEELKDTATVTMQIQ